MQPLRLAKRFYFLVGIVSWGIASPVFSESDNPPSGHVSTTRQAILCDSSQATYRACIHQHFETDIYTKASVLPCGQTEVVVTTSCMDIEEKGVVYCFNQNVAFLHFSKGKEDIYKNINYSHPPHDHGSEPFVTRASCVQVGKKYYVELRNTNFGNCMGCEWSDYFTNQGKYLGSTEGYYRSRTSFTYKTISSRLYDRLMRGEWIEQENGKDFVYISRVRD